MDQKPPARIMRIHMTAKLYETLKAASEEDGMTLSSFGRRILVRAMRVRGRDKTLRNPLTDPSTEGGE